MKVKQISRGLMKINNELLIIWNVHVHVHDLNQNRMEQILMYLVKNLFH